MTRNPNIKETHNFKYYTGAEPKIQALFRQGRRPREFGNKVWATSLVMLDYFHQNPAKVRDQRVLEIGCGWGLIGVYLAKNHSCDVTCTDLDESVLPVVTLHADLNNVTVQVQRASFNDLSDSFLKGFDLIVGAEVCYSEEVAKDIALLIQRALQAGVKEVLIADPGRPDFTECYSHCKERHETTILNLPGSINGKTTQLLSCRA